MANRDVWADMVKYGRVAQVYADHWRALFPGVGNGVRIIKIVLNKPIVIGGYKTGCTYDGQQKHAATAICQLIQAKRVL